MEAHELRIGNYFQYWPAFQQEKVIDVVIATNLNPIKFHKRVKGKKSGWNQETQCHPIDLTPEILEKAGFKVASQGFTKWIKKNNFTLAEDDISEKYHMIYHSKDITVNIYYLHRLQNLYFELTGEELQINL